MVAPSSRHSTFRASRAALLALLALGISAVHTGCTTTPVPRGSQLVTTKPAEFYRRGPAQDPSFQLERFSALLDDVGPDFQLPAGAHVTMLQREFGFSKVRTRAGDVGYVANELLRPAPSIAEAAPTEFRQPRSAPTRRRSAPPARMQEEQLDLSDIPLPLPS